MTDVQPGAAGSPPQLSADRQWWWNGTEWVKALSDDGLWQWNGSAWQTTVPIDRGNPPSAVEALERLADARFAEGGHILVTRAHEWQAADPELQRIIVEASPAAARLAQIDQQLATMPPSPPQGILGGLLNQDPRRPLENEAQHLEQQLRPQFVAVGRLAPTPSIKEADEVLAPARALHGRALELQTLLTDARDLEAAHAVKVSSAQQGVAAAEAARAAQLSELHDALAAREREHEEALADLRQALRDLRLPPLGVAELTVGGIGLYEHRLDTPDGRAPLRGVKASAGTAEELWTASRPLLEELFMLEATHAGRFHDALVGNSPERFLLVETARLCTVVPVAAVPAEEVDAFIAAMEEGSEKSTRSRAEWKKQVAAAEAAVEAAMADTSAVDAARSALAAAEADPALAKPVDDARAALAAAEQPDPQLAGVRSGIEAALDRILDAPASLAP